MQHDFTEEQRMIIDTARRMAKSFGPEYWFEKEEKGLFPKEFIEELGKVGFLGLGIPEEYGGSGLGLTEGAIAFHELCAGGGGAAPALVYLLTSVFGGYSIYRHGNEEQKRKYLPKICDGSLLVSLGLTEPNAGTNTLNLATMAREEGDGYVINGNKVFISGVDVAGAMVLVTRTGRKEETGKRTSGLSLFLIDLPNQAIHQTSIPKHGTNYAHTFELGIEDLRVSKSSLLGEEGKGWYHILDTLNPERIITATGAVGAGRAAIYKAVEYANQRKVFSTVIGAHQGIQFPLASAYAKLECAWLATLRAAALYDRNAPQKSVGDISNLAKYAATEACIEAVYQAMQALGGYGYAKEYHIERWWREVQLFRIAPITQEMTLNYTAEHILGMPRSY
jgi:acyl-CoA dehydrogenase